MIKLPEPDTHCVDTDTGKDVWSHSPEQLKQAVRGALELAFQVAGPEDSYQDERFKAKADSAMRIRALIKEIE